MKIVINIADQDFIIEYFQKVVREWSEAEGIHNVRANGTDNLFITENRPGKVEFYYQLLNEQFIKISLPAGAFKMIAEKIKEIEQTAVEPQEIED
jgi:hypothetical protein